MAARGIRDLRMGAMRPNIQPARPPAVGRPVMTQQPMVRPVAPGNLAQPRFSNQGPPISGPAVMPGAVATPQPVNPGGPRSIQPLVPTTPRMRM